MAIIIGLLTACTPVAEASARASGPRAPAEALAWAECGDGMECAKLTVPVDWRRPDGEKTRIRLARMPARDPGRRLGSLVVNTGAGSTAQAVRHMPAAVTELTTWFDVVLIEPRGMGDRDGDTMVECATPAPSITGLLEHPGRQGWRAHARAAAAHDASCRAAMGSAYAGLNSWQIAHDLEALRIALGMPRLDYFGNSYGTVFAQAYLELFPDRVGRMVLDGVADHTRTSLEKWLLDHARTEERQLRRFRDWCAAGCALRGKDAIEVFDELRARARRAPLPAGGRTLDEPEFLAAVLLGLTPPRWPALAAALREAADGDATALAKLLPSSPQAPGYTTGSLLCHDFMPRPPSYRAFLAIEARLRTAAPRIGWVHGRLQVARCVGMRGNPAYPPRPLPARGLPPVVILIGDTDDNTANLAAEHMAAGLRSARVVRHGDGHAAYLMHGVSGVRDSCLRRYVHDYLTEGRLPAAGARCPGDLVAAIPRG